METRSVKDTLTLFVSILLMWLTLTSVTLAFNRFEQALESLDEMEKVLPDSFDIYDVKSQILLGQERYTERLLKSTSN